MGPLVVAVVAPAKRAPRLLAGLMGRLIRRGFRVELARSDRQAAGTENDIILIPCISEKADPLADEIARKWTEQWTQWYARKRRKKK